MSKGSAFTLRGGAGNRLSLCGPAFIAAAATRRIISVLVNEQRRSALRFFQDLGFVAQRKL